MVSTRIASPRSTTGCSYETKLAILPVNAVLWLDE